MLSGLLAGQQAQAIPVLPPLQLPHHETIVVDNFTGADRQNLSLLSSGGARLDYGERVWGGEFKVDPDGTSQYDNVVAAVIGILAAMMMCRKPMTVIQYQPPPAVPAQAPAPPAPPAGPGPYPPEQYRPPAQPPA
jgi:hypothetical protein